MPMPELATPAIEGADLTKHYGAVVALHGVTVRVARGQSLGLVGPNGAGKSSLIRLLCGLARADQGRVRLDGVDPVGDPVAAKRSLGCVPEHPPLFDLLTGAEHLAWMARLHDVPEPLVRARAEELAGILDLEAALGRRIAGYSKGMRQKLAFAAALIHDPRLLVLDEPFEGVDAIGVRVMKSVIRQFATAGAAVLLTSHILPLVEDVCDHFAVLSEGRLVFEGDREALRRQAERIAGPSGEGRTLESVFHGLVGASAREIRLETLARSPHN